MALLSCTQQELSSGRQILFSVDDFIPEESTKTNCDPTNNYAITWASNDTIGIFPREGFQEPFAIPANQVGKASASFDGGYWDVKEGLTYNAYYPFSTKNFQSADSKTTIPVVYTGQSQTGTQCNAGAFDYTYSDWTTATGGNVSFNFHHIGAFLVLSLPIPASTTYTKLTLTADSEVIPTAGTYDLTASKPAFVSTATASSLSMDLNSFTGTGGETSVFYMMLPPCDLSTVTLTATLTSSAATTCTYTIESKTITAGKLFKITGKSKTSNVEGTVDDWVEEQISYEYVDLGLSVKWATFNVGATKPEEYGDYFAWGETEPYYEDGYAQSISPVWKSGKTSGYDWLSYKYCYGSDLTLTKYCTLGVFGYSGYTDNKNVLEEEDDAATVNWGDYWRMPTYAEMNELCNTANCSWIWTTEAGIYGYRVTSKKTGYTNRSIFIPASFERTGTGLNNLGYQGAYWSKSLNSSGPNDAHVMAVESDRFLTSSTARRSGLCIRPVYDPYNGHEYVDLGLPSGTLWATCNVGASSPEEYGDYFAWGETEPYYEDGYAQSSSPVWKSGKSAGYNWTSYKYCNSSYNTLTKYCNNSIYGHTDSKTVLEPEDDAAAVNWGGAWRMPTKAELDELCTADNCTWTWYDSGNTEFNGIAGYKVTSKKSGYTDRSIFLPTSGSRYNTFNPGVSSHGDYWTCSLATGNSSCAEFLYFSSDDINNTAFNERYYGYTVRPVCQ